MKFSFQPWYWPLLIMGVLIFVSGQTDIATPGFDFSWDKLAHFGVFGALATSIIRIPGFWRHGWKGAVGAALVASAFGGLDEFRQSFTPGRSVEFADWIADSAGACVAVALYQALPAYRRFLELPISSNPLYFRSGSDKSD